MSQSAHYHHLQFCLTFTGVTVEVIILLLFLSVINYLFNSLNLAPQLFFEILEWLQHLKAYSDWLIRGRILTVQKFAFCD